VVQRVTAGLKANSDLKTFWLIQNKQNVDKRFVNFGSSLYDVKNGDFRLADGAAKG
jgi:hypothetical protein